MTFQFFLIASIFSFFVGIALALRSKKALRFFDVMNRWVSVRKLTKPLSTPHYIEPALLKRRVVLGMTIMAGAMISILLLRDADLTPTLALFEGSATAPEIAGVAENLKGFLLVGNAICLLLGTMILFSPRILTTVEGYTDRWFTMRKTMQPLDKMHMEFDCWVLKHPTSVGVALSILSLSAGMLMLNQIQNITT
ncbi:MAG: hypothetical protein HY799_02980 [Nitrosomonadales bacterium]|nr:hypothetical protein [Nitrosomonadales bacterium]